MTQLLDERLIDHKTYIARYGVDLPEIDGWQRHPGGRESPDMPKDTAADNV